MLTVFALRLCFFLAPAINYMLALSSVSFKVGTHGYCSPRHQSYVSPRVLSQVRSGQGPVK